jgi:processive 1,2-diacylglycerol beta-glucosyltransferase
VKLLLVLTSATGAGHDTHAQATAAWCRRLFRDEVRVTVAHALEDSHPFYRGAVNFYNLIQRRAPWFHHAYYNTIELLDALNHGGGGVGLGRAYIVRMLRQLRPDAVLSVHDCLNRGYFELAREVLGPAVKCATYCPEFEGGYGFSRNWVNPRGDLFFARTEETRREGQRRGAHRSLTAGHWAPPSFYHGSGELPPSLEKQPLRSDLFTLLLSTGGAGAQNHRAILRALHPLHARLEVIALCGRDEEARAGLEAWAARETSLQVRCLGFTDRMPGLLRAVSAVVARAGATTAGEALLCGCPVIFNGLGGMMPQELPTWRYFRTRGIGFAALTAAGVRDHIVRWLERPGELAAIRERMARVRDGTTPQAALEKLLDL